MPAIQFAQNNFATDADISAAVVAILGPGRPISITYNQDVGTLFLVDVPDATQAEADAIRASLISTFPAETSGFRSEPHALLCMLDSAPSVWSAMPLALTELRGQGNVFRAGCSLLKVEQVRIVTQVLVAGSLNAVLAAQWSTGAAFAYFDVPNSGPQVSISSTGFKVSPWVNVPAGARADGVAIRVVGSGGNAVASPQFGQILVEGK